MTSIINFAQTDPATIAQQLATSSLQGAQSLLATQTQSAQQSSTALTSLQSALGAFQTALTSLSGSGTLSNTSNSFVSYATTLSNSSVASVTTSAGAQTGNYQFYVQQLASAQDLLYQNVPAVATAQSGTLGVSLADGTNFSVDLTTADTDGDGTLTPAEMARAINQASGNTGKVVASVITVNGQSELQLAAGSTGADSAITLDTSGLQSTALQSALSGPTQLAPAQDAIFSIGGQGGIQVQQSSNTFKGISGVSVTFNSAMSPTDPPLSLTVAQDASGTAANVQKFVDAYNTLKSALDKLTQLGNAASGTQAAALAEDSGVIAMRNRLNQIMRQSFGGMSLPLLGVTANRDGTLSLDQTRLNNTLAANPQALDQVFGNAGLVRNTGMLGALNTYLNSWLDPVTGQITARQASVQATQKSITTRQTALTDQYNNLYQNYLARFSQLQSLESQMNQTAGLFSTSSSSNS
jgi:flagellar hook-associated protein 2